MSEVHDDDDRKFVVEQTEAAAAEIARRAADPGNGREDMIQVGAKEYPLIDYKLLVRLLAGVAGAAGLVWLMLGSPAFAKAPTLAERRAASYACQREAIPKNGGVVVPAVACVCNAKVGLPEYPACRVARGQKGR